MASSSGNVSSSIILASPALPQIKFGTPQTLDGAVTNVAFTAPTNQPVLTFTPARSGRWKIWCNAPISSATILAVVGVRLNATAGSPTLVFGGDANFSQAVAALPTPVYCFGIYDLIAGTSYTFKLELKASLGAITLSSSAVANGTAIIGEEFSA